MEQEGGSQVAEQVSATKGMFYAVDRPVRLPRVGDEHARKERQHGYVGEGLFASFRVAVEQGEQACAGDVEPIAGTGYPRAGLVGVQDVGCDELITQLGKERREDFGRFDGELGQPAGGDRCLAYLVESSSSALATGMCWLTIK